MVVLALPCVAAAAHHGAQAAKAASAAADCVKVVVRCRPMNEAEKVRQCERYVVAVIAVQKRNFKAAGRPTNDILICDGRCVDMDVASGNITCRSVKVGDGAFGTALVFFRPSCVYDIATLPPLRAR